ncbi:Uncharacterised protein [Yersinia frederiksenii]|nr:Uncharacterised protein [Yersinia frederiksenii]
MNLANNAVCQSTGNRSIRLNTAGKKCDVFLHNGLKLLNFPIDKVVDGPQWLEILPLIDGDGFDFEGFTTKPRQIALEGAPEWVKELELKSKIQ